MRASLFPDGLANIQESLGGGGETERRREGGQEGWRNGGVCICVH